MPLDRFLRVPFLCALLLLSPLVANADDVILTIPDGDGFSVRDHTGIDEHLRVIESSGVVQIGSGQLLLTNEAVRWDGVDGRFELTDDLQVIGVLQAGGTTATPAGVAYHRFSNDSVHVADNTVISSGQDVYIEDDLEVGSEIIITGTQGDGVGRLRTPEVVITGGADISEQFRVTDSSGGPGESPEPGSVLCIDAERPGELRLCDRAYDRTVVGVISGAGDVGTGLLMGDKGSIADGDVPVALTGRVYVRAHTTGGPIRPGDMLTTSSSPGLAARVDDFERARGAVIGKAMTELADGHGLVLVLVSLQ